MSKTIARIDKIKTLQISGQLDESSIGDLKFDPIGNLGGKEIVEVLQRVNKVETSQADFNAGTLTNLQTDSSGYITVVQAVGATTTVFEDFEDTTYQFTFTNPNGTTNSWTRDNRSTDAYAGGGSWQSASMRPKAGTHQQSISQFSYTIPTGSINPKVFGYYKVSSELGYDFFSIQVNGVEQTRDSGNSGWKYWEYPLVIGSNTVTFTYDIDGATSSGSNCSWIDNLSVSYQASVGQSTGNRISPAIDLSSIPDKISGSTIQWTSNVPTGTSLVIESSISTDNGTTWGPWVAETNNTSIASLANITSTSNLQLKTRMTFTSNSDSTLVPKLYDITIDVEGFHEYKLGQTTLQVGHFEEGVTLT